MPRSRRPLEIHKFGGASLANGAAIAHAVSVIRAQRPAPLVVVVSAMAGVTDALLDLASAAVRGDADGARATLDRLAAQHRAAVAALVRAAPRAEELLQAIEGAFAEVEPLAAGLRVLRELTPRTTDYLVARGEYLSARIVAAALDTAGCPAAYVDAVEVIHTDGTFGNASPDLRRTERSARRVLRPLLARGVVPVVPGFLGAAPDGQAVTLGRGGSDLTATLLARALGAREVSLWKDVPGVLTADPRIVPDARVIPQLHVREAAELAYYGAKVLHPRALVPVLRRSVAVRIRPFAEPASLGTEISRRRTLNAYPVKALSAIPKQALLTVTGSGMLGVPGIAARAFAAVHHEGISVSLISQASSEQSICFSVPEDQAERARRGLDEAFRREIGRQEIDRVEVRAGAATLVVVGLGMAGTPGIAARVFSALAEAKINVIAIAQGSSELNLSLVVDAGAAARALRVVHGVLANKRPITVSRRRYDDLRATAAAHGRQLLHEATVGAGLPIMDTYAKLVGSGDRVQRIEGCPSGTLGYLFGELGRGRRFSEALRGAIAKGYPEPDPREDLSGMDVARKALILGRLLGFPGELRDVAVESLVPKGAERLPLAEFLARLEQYDAPWTRRVALARQRGGVVRYRAIVTRRRIRVGLVVVDASSPMASLNGTDNQFIFTTMRYRKNPLVITGPGAGPAVTAGGILNDVLKLASA